MRKRREGIGTFTRARGGGASSPTSALRAFFWRTT